MIVSKCWKPSEPVIIIIHRILQRGLSHAQWAFSLVIGKMCWDLQYGASLPVNKHGQFVQCTVSHNTFEMCYTSVLILLFNHLSLLQLFWTYLTSGMYEQGLSDAVALWTFSQAFHVTDSLHTDSNNRVWIVDWHHHIYTIHWLFFFKAVFYFICCCFERCWEHMFFPCLRE